MTTFAMFVKINDQWQFSGLTDIEEKATEFEDRVAEDIELTADLDTKTQASKVVSLDD